MAKVLTFLTIAAAFNVAALASGACQAQEQSGNTQIQDGQEPILKVGNGVSPPRIIHQEEPEFSEQARASRYQGTCVLSVVVGEDGKPRDIKVTRRLGMGLDEKAVEAVQAWRFEPARKDGKPVATMVAVQVDFHLYGNGDARIAKLTRKAAGGDAKAELELSTMYLEGQDVPKNERLGLVFLERAAGHGLPKAQFLLGERVTHETVPLTTLERTCGTRWRRGADTSIVTRRSRN
jgi:TonB family protein